MEQISHPEFLRIIAAFLAICGTKKAVACIDGTQNYLHKYNTTVKYNREPQVCQKKRCQQRPKKKHLSPFITLQQTMVATSVPKDWCHHKPERAAYEKGK